VKANIRFWLAAVCFTSLPLAAHADWQATEKVQTYAISGKTGPDLYASIGERGPEIGGGLRTIAHTNFKLTWSRKYDPQPDGSCTLTSARPNLIITYVLPKPAEKLPADIRANWDIFVEGVRKHELVHGTMTKDMVKAIEAVSVGLSVSNDPDCSKIRTELTTKLSELSQAQRQRSRDFDKVEMTGGGNIHQLILGLVNGG
jgi:predicted secreted Zn-dependent protease